jgi:tetratricopeptide (TPR) repeat protein
MARWSSMARKTLSKTTAPGDSAIPSSWRIRLLRGRLEVEKVADGQPTSVDIGTGRVPVGLVVRLAAQRDLGVVPTELIASCCYKEVEFDNWQKGIEQAASRLRRGLGLPIARGAYRLEMNPDDVDLLKFDRLAKKAFEDLEAKADGAVSSALQALDLWQQPPNEAVGNYELLKGLFDPFISRHRRLTRALATHLIRIRSAEADSFLEDALCRYPHDPDLEALLGEAAEVNRHRGPTRHNLPMPDESPLIGRQLQFGRVRGVLRPYPASQHAIVTIDGVGGVGKTALAKAVAYSYVGVNEGGDPDPGFDAIIWTSAKRTVLRDSVVSLSPQLRNLDDIHSQIATTLGRSDVLASNQTERDRLIRELLSDQDHRVLLIIDNLETVDDHRIFEFLRDLPAPTKAIITTRHRIEGALPQRLEGLSAEDARTLSVEAAQKAGLILEPDELERIANYTSGIPLAILWTISQIARMGDPESVLLRLRSASGDYAEFCFRDSVGRLAGHGDRISLALLLALSLFADPASREAVGFVAGVNERPTDRDRALTLLTDLSLVNFVGGRFSLLPLTREFVSGELGRDLTLREPAVERWLGWHQSLTARAAAGGADLDSGVLDLLRLEHTNVLWAIDFAMRGDRPDVFVPLVRSMEFFWLGEGLWGDFEHYLERARTLSPTPEDKLHFACRLIWLHVLREDLEAADAMKVQAELLLRRYEVPYERMRLEDFAGQLALTRGELDEAEACFMASLNLADELEDRRGKFACSKYLGELWCARGDSGEATRFLELATAHVGDPTDKQWLRGLAHASQLQGAIAELDNHWAAAESSYGECLRLLGFHRDVRLESKALEGLARSLAAQGDRQGAVEIIRRAGAIYEELGMWHHSERIDQIASSWLGGTSGRL